jgi:hypothetical protein
MDSAAVGARDADLLERLSGWRFSALAFILTRAVLTLVGLAGVAILGEGGRRLHLAPDFPWLELWAQWDSGHYIRIATEGYSFAPGTETNIPFFPLYPLLIRVVMVAIGRVDTQTATLVGFIIANAALFVALLYLAALVTRDLSLSVARRTVVYVLVFPMTFFLSAVYAESLFLATGAACVYHARQGEWYRSGLAGGLAALTRPYGFLLVIPIAIEMWRQRAPVRFLPSIALVPAGLAVYLGYLWTQFGTPFIYFEANQQWRRGLNNPLTTLENYIRGPLVLYDWPYSVLDIVSMVAMAILVVVGWRLIPRSYLAYAATGVLFALTSGVAWFSASRHALALFPIIIILAVLGERSRAFGWAWLVLSAVLAVGFMARFAAGHWVA